MACDRTTWAALLCALITSAGPACAQEMVFTVEQTGQPPAPVADDAPPSEALANGLRLYQGERHREAAVQFARVVSGQTDDAPSGVHRAQFFLAKSLYHLRYFRGALSLLEEIARAGPSHRYFEPALPWLAQLATRLPDAAGIVELVGRYPPAMVRTLDRDETREVHDHLLYLSGRHAYEQGDFEPAIDRLGRVSERSIHYGRARFLAAVTHVRQRRAQPAIAAFREVLDAAERGSIDDAARMRNLAWISLARVYYTAANRTDERGERTIDPLLLDNAIAAWDRVEPGSELWLDALFEQAWGLYVAHEESRAMGNLFTLHSPYFADAYYPESLVIKAVVFFGACQTENAMAMIQQFHGRYDPVRDELDETLSGLEDNESLYRFLVGVRQGSSSLPPRVRAVVTEALSDRTLLRHLEYVHVLESELSRLESEPGVFRDSSLGDRLRADVAVTRSFAIDRAGELVRGRFARLIEQLDELMTQMDLVEAEIYRVRREGLTAEERAERERIAEAGGLEVEVDEEHQVWPFDGEYWRDELPFYRQQVSSICTR